MTKRSKTDRPMDVPTSDLDISSDASRERLLNALRVIEAIAASDELLPEDLDTETEKSLHASVSTIYRVAHVARGTCQAEHEDWEEEFQRLADQLFKQ